MTNEGSLILTFTTLKMNLLFTKCQVAVLTLFGNILGFAQISGTPDLKVDIDARNSARATQDDWLGNPLMWVIGALLLILIAALIARGISGNKD